MKEELSGGQGKLSGWQRSYQVDVVLYRSLARALSSPRLRPVPSGLGEGRRS